MANFRYHAQDAAGNPLTGEIAADSVQQALAELESRGITIQSIGHASSTPSVAAESPTAQFESTAAPTADAFSSPPVIDCEQSVLLAHMAKILERGRAITPALRAYADELPAGAQRRQLLAVCRVLARGNVTEATYSLADLPEYWIPLLSAATTSSDPGHVLSEFISESRRTGDLRHQWWLTLAYPLVLAALALAVMLALSFFVIPEFANIFNEFDLQLPSLTQLILGTARWLVSWQGLLTLALFTTLALFALNANRLLPRSTIAWLSDWIRPPFGQRAAIARLARFLADLLEAGLSPPDALRIAGHCVQRARMRRAASRLATDLESGGLRRRNDFRPLSAAVWLALTAEMTNPARVHLLREISAAQAERVRVGLSWANGLVEPAAILLVGMVIGVVVVGLFLPLINLVSSLSG